MSPSCRHPCPCIFRRPPDLGPHPGGFTPSDRSNLVNANVSRVSHKLREVGSDSGNVLHVVRNKLEHSKRYMERSSRQSNSYKSNGNRAHQNWSFFSQGLGTVPRTCSVRLPVSLSHEEIFPSNSKSTTPCSSKEKERNSVSSPTTSSRSETLDKRASNISPQSLHINYSRTHRNNFFGRPHGSGPLVTVRENEAHQPSGNYSNPEGNQSHRLEAMPLTHNDRQRNGAFLIAKKGQQIPIDSQDSMDATGRSSSKEDPLLCEPQTVLSKQGSRCFEPQPSSTHGMVLRPRRVSTANKVARPYASRPNGDTVKPKTPGLRVPFLPPIGNSDRCTGDRLESLGSDLCVPAEEFPDGSTTETSVIPVPWSNNYSKPSICPVVSQHSSAQQEISSSSPPTMSNSTRSSRILQLRSMDRVEFLRCVWTEKHGAAVANRLVQAYRTSTSRQFQSAWKSFQSWLPEETPNLSKKTVLEFLLFLQDVRHLQPRTILVYRSALSLPLSLGFNIDTADQEFSLLAKAQFLTQPPASPRLPSWSLDKALDSLLNPPFHPTDSSEYLFLKTLFLVALASGNRVSELAACVRVGSTISINGITLATRSGFLFKNQSILRKPSAISFPAIDLKHPLCPGACLQQYMKDTSNTQNKGYLFVHPSTGLPLKAGRLAYWLWKGIRLSANPSQAFGAHDMRKISHSIAWLRGVPIESILKNGSWQSPNVFINNYCTSLIVPTKDFVAGRTLVNP